MKKTKIHLIEKNLIDNYKKYYKLAYTYTHNDSDAIDIVQEGAYKAISKSSSLKDVNYVDTWIYRIMINESINFLNKNKKHFDNIDNINLSTDDKYENIDLKTAINSLEEPEKSIIILKFFDELKLTEISDILDINLNTTKSKLYRGLKKLRLLIGG